MCVLYMYIVYISIYIKEPPPLPTVPCRCHFGRQSFGELDGFPKKVAAINGGGGWCVLATFKPIFFLEFQINSINKPNKQTQNSNRILNENCMQIKMVL